MISDILLLNVLNSRIVPSDWNTVGETIYNILNLSVYRLWEHNVSIESLLLNVVDAVYGVRPFTPSEYLNTVDIYRPADSRDWQDISLAHALYFTKVHTTEEKSDAHLVALGLCPLLTAYGTDELRSRFIEAIETSSHTGWDNIIDYITILEEIESYISNNRYLVLHNGRPTSKIMLIVTMAGVLTIRDKLTRRIVEFTCSESDILYTLLSLAGLADRTIGDSISTEIALYGHIVYEDTSRIVLDIK